MKILVLKSSWHRGKSSSNILADNFIKGAQQAGHETAESDISKLTVNACMACDFCRKNIESRCVQKDSMEQLRAQILASDMIVFTTPLYYYGVCAQLKTVIDRFYAFNDDLMAKHMKTALICTAWDDADWTMESIENYYKTLCRYLHFEDMGTVLGTACGTPDMTRNTEFPEKAYKLGLSLK